MPRAPRFWSIGAVLAAQLTLVPAASAQMLKCKGDLVFEDSMARRVTLFVDAGQGLVTNPSCHKYPELRGFCAGVITRAKDGDFIFDTTVSEENSKLRIDLVRTNGAIGTDTVLNWWPRATFLGRCEPTRVAVRHRRT
jgi:hypothetical protein